MNPDSKLYDKIYLFVFFILAFSLHFAFSQKAIAEDGYKELLLLKLGSQYLDLVKISIPILSFLSSVLIFKAFSSKPEHNEHSLVPFLVSLIFLFSPLILFNVSYSYSIITALVVFLFTCALFLFFHFNSSVRYVSLVPLVIAAYLAYNFLDPSFSLAKIKDVGIILPLSSIAIVLIIKDKIDASVMLFIIGLFASAFLPSFSIVALSFSAILSVKSFFKFDDMLFWAVFVLFLVFYIFFNPAKENYTYAIGASLALSLIVYFLLPLFNLSKSISAFIVFLVALSFTNSMFLLEQKDLKVLSSEELEVFNSALKLQGTFGVLDYEYSFEYYSGKKPKILNTEDLLETKNLEVDYVLLDSKALNKMLESRPIVFSLSSVSLSNGNYIADFKNENYLIRLFLSKDSELITDGVLFDLTRGGQGRTVSFPKLKPFNKIKLLDGNVLINTENILDTNLYNLLFVKTTISEARGVKLIENN